MAVTRADCGVVSSNFQSSLRYLPSLHRSLRKTNARCFLQPQRLSYSELLTPESLQPRVHLSVCGRHRDAHTSPNITRPRFLDLESKVRNTRFLYLNPTAAVTPALRRCNNPSSRAVTPVTGHNANIYFYYVHHRALLSSGTEE
jgi:hypothetical protein